MDRAPLTLDQGRWRDLWSRLGAQGDALPVFEMLARSYAEPHRAYHTAQHLADCLTLLDQTRDLAGRPDEVEAALWFHDAVYRPGAPDNEAESALLAQQTLEDGGVPTAVSRSVTDLVLATTHLTPALEKDSGLLCDIDLAVLGREPAVFDDFERRIRQEYAWVPEPTYRTSRIEVLAAFLRRPFIYQRDYFRTRYEAPARQNLERLIGGLSS